MASSPININSLSGPELARYVEEQLSHPLWRSMRSIATDFVGDDGEPVDRQSLVNRLRFAEPGVLIEYKAVGVLLRHKRIAEPVVVVVEV